MTHYSCCFYKMSHQLQLTLLRETPKSKGREEKRKKDHWKQPLCVTFSQPIYFYSFSVGLIGKRKQNNETTYSVSHTHYVLTEQKCMPKTPSSKRSGLLRDFLAPLYVRLCWMHYFSYGERRIFRITKNSISLIPNFIHIQTSSLLLSTVHGNIALVGI